MTSLNTIVYLRSHCGKLDTNTHFNILNRELELKFLKAAKQSFRKLATNNLYNVHITTIDRFSLVIENLNSHYNE